MCYNTCRLAIQFIITILALCCSISSLQTSEIKKKQCAKKDRVQIIIIIIILKKFKLNIKEQEDDNSLRC